jgi:Lipocalin-like domain
MRRAKSGAAICEGAAMKTLLLVLGLVLSTLPSSAADRTPLIGVWKLLSYQTEFQDGSPKRALFGEHPTGYIIFTSEGRMMALIEGEGRKVPASDADRAALLKTMIAYTGKYRVTGSQWVTTVDTAWNPAWVGTDQVRSYELVGDRLTVTSMWQPAVNISGSPVARGILVFERVR